VNRRVAALALCLVVGASCSSDPSSVERAAGSTTTTAAPNGPAVPSSEAPPTSAGVRRPSTTTFESRPVPSTTQPGPADLGDPGAGAPRYLRPAMSTSIRLQVVVAPGAEPRQATVDRLRTVLASVSGKPVSVSGATLPASGAKEWTAASIAGAAADRVPRLDGDVALLQLVFLTGTYGDDEGVLGIAVNARVAAVFGDRVSAAATGLVEPDRIELAVATHEVGHLLGLVDLFLRTGRADPEHPGHSSSSRSVMYWAVESDLVGDLLTGGPPVDFDAADRADLATIRRG
jgi:hypothetical protein